MFWKNIQNIFVFLFVIVLAKILCLDELDIESNSSTILNVVPSRSTIIADTKLSSAFPQSEIDSIEKSDHNFYLPIVDKPIKITLTSSNLTDIKPKRTVRKNPPTCRTYWRKFTDKINHQCSSKYISRKNGLGVTFSNSTENCERPLFFGKDSQNNELKISSFEKEDSMNISSQKDDSTSSSNKSGDNIVDDIILIKSAPVSAKDMLSFEEWRRKISEQIDSNIDRNIKTKTDLIVDAEPSGNLLNPNNQAVKLSTNRARNFASNECGAKVVDFNAEAEFVNRVLNEQTDEYMLNPCKTKNWFVIELCETIQPQYLEMANFELYSSIPKEFAVYASEHYPNRNEWSLLGSFSSSDIRSVQGFKLQNNGFVKYLKIHLFSYYGSEHFCPISVIRLFGTSLFDEVERIDNSEDKKESFRKDDENSIFEESLTQTSSSKPDIIGHAKRTVLNIFMKALNFNIFNKILENFSMVKDSTVNFNIFHQSQVIKLYPKLHNLLPDCEIFFNGVKNSTINIPSKCIFFRLSFSESLFDMLYTQYFIHKFINNQLMFQCGLNGTYSDINTTSLSLNLSHSIQTPGSRIKSINKSISSDLSDQINEGTLKNIGQVAMNKSNSTIISENIVTSASFSESLIDFNLIESSLIEPTFIPSLTDTIPLPSSILISNDVSSYESLTRNNVTSTVVPEIKTESVQMPSVSQSEFETDLQALSSSGGQSKEAVIVRLTSRIKNLEKNISLMSTYLENLSVRYRKQMEEMQFIFNKTIDHLNNTAIRAADKDSKQQEFIMALEEDIAKLNTRLSNLSNEVDEQNMFYIKIHIFLMIFGVIFVALLCLIFYLIFRRILCSLPKSDSSGSTIKNDISDINNYLNSTTFTNKKTYLSRSKSLPDMKTEQRFLNFLKLYDKEEDTSNDVKNLFNPVCDSSIDKENQRPMQIAPVCTNNYNNKQNNNIPNGFYEPTTTTTNNIMLKASSPCVENILKTLN